ncbi:MAG: NAD(P)/FAD-dependent oxidoreductase [Candidatus Acidiferrum sp.]
MKKNVVVIGAGMGGLTAALRLAREGFRVQVLEARAEAGGLASGNVVEGFAFDAGPYILLDRPGLEWAFASVGLKLSEHIELRVIDHVYSVVSPDRPVVNIYSSDAKTASELEQTWPGSGELYLRFVRKTGAIESSLRPLLYGSAPGLTSLIGSGRWRHAGFLMRSLHSVLRVSRLPQPVMDALSIWTHVAGQRPEEAPSPLAFVPALVHSVGCFYPKEGIRTIPQVLAKAAAANGVEFRYRTKVRKICVDGAQVTGVESAEGERFSAGAVVSDCGIATYLDLVEQSESASQKRCEKLPLQSPGVCAYLAVKGKMEPPYLRFLLPGGEERCRLLIRTGVLNPEEKQGDWYPARLLGPMDHAEAQRMGSQGQAEYLERLLEEKWWQAGITEFRVLARRTPAEWGSEFSLARDSMNPVMTAKFMREGRLAHRSPDLRGLYLAGSATHPGQWVSFCAISGVLAADCLRKDFA